MEWNGKNGWGKREVKKQFEKWFDFTNFEVI